MLHLAQKLKVAEDKNEKFRQQLRQLQDELVSLRASTRVKDHLIKHLVSNYKADSLDSSIPSSKPTTDSGEEDEDRPRLEEFMRPTLANHDLRRAISQLNGLSRLLAGYNRMIIETQLVGRNVADGIWKLIATFSNDPQWMDKHLVKMEFV